MARCNTIDYTRIGDIRKNGCYLGNEQRAPDEHSKRGTLLDNKTENSLNGQLQIFNFDSWGDEDELLKISEFSKELNRVKQTSKDGSCWTKSIDWATLRSIISSSIQSISLKFWGVVYHGLLSVKIKFQGKILIYRERKATSK